MTGIGVVIYASYLPHPGIHMLEKLTEGIVAHRPLPSDRQQIAGSIASIIQKELEFKQTPWKIILLDKDSARFMDEHWVADMSVRMGILISVNIPEYHHYNFYWNTDEESLEVMEQSDIVHIITDSEIDNIDTYIFGTREKLFDLQLLNREIIRMNTYLYNYRVKDLVE